MPYLLHICFDNSRRLIRKRYYFEYRGLKFKLVQSNPRKWADHLLTIIPDNDRAAHEQAFSVAAEFLSALGWENGARIAMWDGGGHGFPQDFSLKEAKPNIFTFPRIPFGGNVVGYDLIRIPHIKTDAQRIALGLFREANASNNDYLSFLFFWQVLETGAGDPVGFINKAFSKHRSQLRLHVEDIGRLPLSGRSLGNYLLDDCRHAIAHIRRRPGKTRLDIDKPSERLRLALSSSVIKEFAEHYVRENLGLKESLFLAYRKRGEIPVYVDLRAPGNYQYHCVLPAHWHQTRRSTRRTIKSGTG